MRQRAKRSLGQNFLCDPNYITKIIASVRPSTGDTIIEIGPGRGALTEKLVDSAAGVIAIELDRQLIDPLRQRFANCSNFQVIEQDALTVDYGQLLADARSSNERSADSSDSRSQFTAKLVANLPYNISTAILQHLAEQRQHLSSLVLMFQREVVERMIAKPGNSDRGFFTVLVESAFEVENLFDVPPAAFRPVPKVWSSVVRLTPKPKVGSEASLKCLLSAAFAQKRKTIANNLKREFPDHSRILAAAGIDSHRRAESLTLDEWNTLNTAVSPIGRE
ncbi:MAG: 16S rRNA (adenine(1518)-N(6)/adenine(1519)-N(6))-dimethyltransferase RsmA [Pyrinomonadaceae bacterium]